MSDPTPPPGVDASRPSVARIYDYLLGGKDNFAVDRAIADQNDTPIPHGPTVANREFLGRAVRYLAEQGIRQFIDLGTGLPTQNNVHQVAKRVDPKARVVYTDNDPVVLAHGRALLVDDDTTTVIDADLREPETLLTHPKLTELVDLSQPVGMLFVAVLHFVPDDEQAANIVAAYADVMVPGSYLVISNVADRPDVTELTQTYTKVVSGLRPRSRAQVERLFDGFDLVGPGVVDVRAWPDPDTGNGMVLGGVGRKR